MPEHLCYCRGNGYRLQIFHVILFNISLYLNIFMLFFDGSGSQILSKYLVLVLHFLVSPYLLSTDIRVSWYLVISWCFRWRCIVGIKLWCRPALSMNINSSLVPACNTLATQTWWIYLWAHHNEHIPHNRLEADLVYSNTTVTLIEQSP